MLLPVVHVCTTIKLLYSTGSLFESIVCCVSSICHLRSCSVNCNTYPCRNDRRPIMQSCMHVPCPVIACKERETVWQCCPYAKNIWPYDSLKLAAMVPCFLYFATLLQRFPFTILLLCRNLTLHDHNGASSSKHQLLGVGKPGHDSGELSCTNQ